MFCGDIFWRQAAALEYRRSAGSAKELARIVGQIRGRWPRVQIMLRADSGFCPRSLNGLVRGEHGRYVFGLPQRAASGAHRQGVAEAERLSRPARQPTRVFRDFLSSTKESWSRRRRVMGKAEGLAAKPTRALWSPRSGPTHGSPAPL